MDSHPHQAQFVSSAAGSARLWLKSIRSVWLDYVIIFVVFAVTYFAVLTSLPQFVPDSQYYLGMAYWFGGMNQQEALTAVRELGFTNGPGLEQMFGWGLVQPRVILPALATPLVMLFGAHGLTITTGLITVLLLVVLYSMLSAQFGRLPALATLILAMSSMYIMWFNTAMLTESLSALWGALTLIAARKYQQQRSVGWVIAMVAVTSLSGFTRQATFIAAGAFVIAWLVSLFFGVERKKWQVPALAVAGTALAVQLFQSLVFPSFSQADQFMLQTGTSSLGDALLATPGLAMRILGAEIDAFATNDQALLILIVLSLISMVVFWKRPESHLLLGAILGIALYNITNGTSTSFRYAMPGLAFYLVSVAMLLNLVDERIRRPVIEASVSGTPRASLPQN